MHLQLMLKNHKYIKVTFIGILVITVEVKSKCCFNKDAVCCNTNRPEQDTTFTVQSEESYENKQGLISLIIIIIQIDIGTLHVNACNLESFHYINYLLIFDVTR